MPFGPVPFTRVPRGHSLAIIAGENEFAAQNCQLKNLKSAQSQTVSLAAGSGPLIDAFRREL